MLFSWSQCNTGVYKRQPKKYVFCISLNFVIHLYNMKKENKDDLIQVRCQKWMKEYVDSKGALTDGGAAWVRSLILEQYNKDRARYDIQPPAGLMVAENHKEKDEDHA